MLKQIELNKRKIEYTLKISKRAKRLRLSIGRNCSLIVTVPHRFNLNFAEKFIVDKAKWVLEKLDYFASISKLAVIKHTRADYLKYRPQAQLLAKQKVEQLNKYYNFKYRKITIRNQKTRWGSCSKKGNLSFSYRIVLLPEEITDYIIIHELCHLGEFNHSKKFWNLVRKTVPNYVDVRKDLKKRGLSFM